MKRAVSWIMIVIWTLTIVVGCQQKSTEIRSDDLAATSEIETTDKATMLDGAPLATALTGNLLLPSVAAFVDTMQNWGYTYRQGNSIVVTHDRYRSVFVEELGDDVPATKALDKERPSCGYFSQFAGSDTLVWQVFENPAYDSSIHTAVISAYRDGRVNSAFIEVDLSAGVPSFIRGGMLTGDGEVVDSVFAKTAWEDYSICVGACCATAMIACILSGPGWPACAAAGCLDCYPLCAIHSLFTTVLDWIS